MKIEFSKERLKQIITEEVESSHHHHDAEAMPTGDAVTRKIEKIMADLTFIKKEVEEKGTSEGEEGEGCDPWIKDKLAVISALTCAITAGYKNPSRN